MNATTVTSNRRLFAILFGINVLNYADRFTLPAVETLLKADPKLHLTDSEIGLLGTAFLLVYAIAAPPLGALADSRSRSRVVAAGVGLWSIATAATALARGFPQLFAVRAVLGIGEASYFPASTSLLADAFPLARRARVMAWWNTATPIGVFLGFGLGGFVGEHFGWQSAFLLVGLPGLVLASLAWQMKEPPRGMSEGITETHDPNDEGFLGIRLLRIRSLAFAIVGQVFAFFMLGGLSFWVTAYLVHRFRITASQASLLAGGLFVVGGGVGTVAGGYIADWLLRRMPSARMFVPALGFLSSGLVVILGYLAPNLPLFLVAYTSAGALISVYGGPLSAMVQDVVRPAARARAVALQLLLAHVFGDAFAPPLLGFLSDQFGGSEAGGLEKALWLAPVAVIIAGLVCLIGCRYVGDDRQAMVKAVPMRAGVATL